MAAYFNLRSSLRGVGLRPARLMGLALILAAGFGLSAGCGGATEPEPAGLPEGVTDFSPKVAPPKNAKVEPGSSADTSGSAPASK